MNLLHVLSCLLLHGGPCGKVVWENTYQTKHDNHSEAITAWRRASVYRNLGQKQVQNSLKTSKHAKEITTSSIKNNEVISLHFWVMFLENFGSLRVFAKLVYKRIAHLDGRPDEHLDVEFIMATAILSCISNVSSTVTIMIVNSTSRCWSRCPSRCANHYGYRVSTFLRLGGPS